MKCKHYKGETKEGEDECSRCKKHRTIRKGIAGEI